MPGLLIVHHSNTGGTAALAQAALAGAAAEGEARLLTAAEAGPEAMLAAAGYLFAMPETLAAIAGPMKSFLDRCYYPLLGAIEGRAYGLIVCAGSDGTNAVRQATRICTGWRLRAVVEPLVVVTGAQSAEAILATKVIPAERLEEARVLGATLAAGLAMGVF